MIEEDALNALYSNEDALGCFLGYSISQEHFSLYKEGYKFIQEYLSGYGELPHSSLLSQRYGINISILPDIDKKHCDFVAKELVKKRAMVNYLEHLTDSVQVFSSMSEAVKYEDLMSLLETHRGKLEVVIAESTLTKDVEYFSNIEGRVQKYIEKAQKRKSGNGVIGIDTGFHTINKHTGGWAGGDFGLVVSYLGTGKTWILSCFASAAALSGKRVLVISPEMSAYDLSMRLDTIISHKLLGKGFSNSGLVLGENVNEQEYSSFIKMLNGKGFLAISTTTTAGKTFTPNLVRSRILLHNPDIVFVDGAVLLGSDNFKGGGWEYQADISRQLKNTAMMFNVPIIAAAQSKPVTKLDYGVKAAETNEVAYSSAFPQDASLQYSLAHHPEFGLSLVCRKNRATGKLFQVNLGMCNFDAGVFNENLSGNVGEMSELF